MGKNSVFRWMQGTCLTIFDKICEGICWRTIGWGIRGRSKKAKKYFFGVGHHNSRRARCCLMYTDSTVYLDLLKKELWSIEWIVKQGTLQYKHENWRVHSTTKVRAYVGVWEFKTLDYSLLTCSFENVSDL
jgi:hypothetical protein